MTEGTPPTIATERRWGTLAQRAPVAWGLTLDLAKIPAPVYADLAHTPPPPPPPPVVRPRVRPSRSSRGCGSDMETCLAAIARCESGGRYDAENATSTASGRYQALKGTWDGYGGYAEAKDAPPEVQEAWAREAYAKAGTRPWNASRHCWGR